MKTVQLLLIVTFVGLVTAGGESQSTFSSKPPKPICPSCKCTGDDDDEERNDDLKDCACPEGAEEHSYRPWFTTYKCCKYPPPRFRHWPPECEQENLSDEVVPNNNDPTMVNGPPFCPPPSVRLIKSVDRVIIYSCCKYPTGYRPCYS